MTIPGIRLHKRTMPVEEANGVLGRLLIRWQQEHDLTDIEAAKCITTQLDRLLKYRLRAERHPGDPDKKADEA